VALSSVLFVFTAGMTDLALTMFFYNLTQCYLCPTSRSYTVHFKIHAFSTQSFSSFLKTCLDHLHQGMNYTGIGYWLMLSGIGVSVSSDTGSDTETIPLMLLEAWHMSVNCNPAGSDGLKLCFILSRHEGIAGQSGTERT